MNVNHKNLGLRGLLMSFSIRFGENPRPSRDTSGMWYKDTRYALEGRLMAFDIKKPETDALARKVAAPKKIELPEAVHTALGHELEREQGRPSLVGLGVQFCRDLRT